MNLHTWRATTLRVLRQLAADRRTVALILMVRPPCWYCSISSTGMCRPARGPNTHGLTRWCSG